MHAYIDTYIYMYIHTKTHIEPVHMTPQLFGAMMEEQSSLVIAHNT